MPREEFYKRVKIAGMVSFIPVILVAGPLGGYFIGDYLEKRFGWPPFVLFICIGIGLASSIREVVRILKLASKIERKP